MGQIHQAKRRKCSPRLLQHGVKGPLCFCQYCRSRAVDPSPRPTCRKCRAWSRTWGRWGYNRLQHADINSLGPSAAFITLYSPVLFSRVTHALFQSQHCIQNNSAFTAQLCSAKSHTYSFSPSTAFITLPLQPNSVQLNHTHIHSQSQHCIQNNSAFTAQLCSAKSHTYSFSPSTAFITLPLQPNSVQLNHTHIHSQSQHCIQNNSAFTAQLCSA